MNIYTIGFTKKSAEDFFQLLKTNNVKTLVDIRLNNSSQLAGFAKGRDLKYFIKEILQIPYQHDIRFSPTKELLDGFKNGEIDWKLYEIEFNKILFHRNIKDVILKEYSNKLEDICLLCSEDQPKHCHRRLVAELIANTIPKVTITHL